MIISPAMLHEHLPYVVMEGLNKVSYGPCRERGAVTLSEHTGPYRLITVPLYKQGARGPGEARHPSQSPRLGPGGTRKASSHAWLLPQPHITPLWDLPLSRLSWEALKAAGHFPDAQPSRDSLSHHQPSPAPEGLSSEEPSNLVGLRQGVTCSESRPSLKSEEESGPQ